MDFELIELIITMLFVVGVFSGRLTRLFVKIKPPWFSEGCAILLVWFTAFWVLVFQLLFLVARLTG